MANRAASWDFGAMPRILRRLHEVVNGFAYAPEQNADADAGTQRDGKPAEKAEVGFCVPSAYAYAPNRRTDDAEGEQHDKEAENTEAHPRSLTILSCNKSMKRIKGSGNAMALTINAKTDKKPMAKGMVSRRFPSVRALSSSCIQATSLNSNAFCLGGRRQGVRPWHGVTKT